MRQEGKVFEEWKEAYLQSWIPGSTRGCGREGRLEKMVGKTVRAMWALLRFGVYPESNGSP